MAWKPDYITTADVKGYLHVDPSDTADDVLFGRWATASSRAVDRKCNRQFGQIAAPAARVYRRSPAYNERTGLFELPIDDLMTAAGLTINGIAYASAGAVLLPDNAPAEGLPWTAVGILAWPMLSQPGAPIVNTLVAQWGWTAVPAQVPAAALLQCARWNFRRDSPAGIAGSPDQGSEIRLLSKLDPDVATTLTGLVRPRRAG